jgi:hypothetical protein
MRYRPIMAKDVHVTRQQPQGWAVKPSEGTRTASVHRTRADAIAAGRRLAQNSGGGDVVVHHADGSVRYRDTVGAAKRRAPRGNGPRTTLRLPDALAETAARLAEEVGISRNDALLRLATRGARLYEQEQRIAVRRAERWAAVVPGAVELDTSDLPSPEQARDAILAARRS